MRQTCKITGKEFQITDDDVKFYEKMGVPIPTLCPEERQQRRLAWRNERKLYHRTCDATGKKIISVYSPEKNLIVYDNDYWYSDAWDGKEYGRDFDFDRPFFEQFAELMQSVPQLARSAVANQNSDFTNQSGWNKDCYLVFEADGNEHCIHSDHAYDSRVCCDSSYVTNCELTFECISCVNCYESYFLQNCKNCSDSFFLKNCIGCKNCFGCVNLRNKEYYFNNDSLTKEEYKEKIASLTPNTFSSMHQAKNGFSAFAQGFPHKSMHGAQNEDSTGDYLEKTKNCHECFDVQNAWDCKFVTNSRNIKNVYDMLVFGAKEGAEWSYEVHEIGGGVRNIMFSDQIWTGCHNIEYSKLCIQNSHNLFGCVGLKKSRYCILNKQYSKEEYFELRDKIIAHMKKTGEWGEFFSIELSPFAYNETVAQEYFPLTKEEILQKNYKWRDDEPGAKYDGPKVEIPDTIAETSDDICNQILECEECSKNYRIVKPELEFYRKMNLPVPHKCSDCRHKARMALRNPRHLWKQNCDNCSKEIETTFSPEKPEKVFCEDCYLKVVE